MSKQQRNTPTVVIDTREQLPYEFPVDWPVVRKALPSGDYSLLGHEGALAIERKSLSDLLGCLFTDRFHRELERLRRYEIAILAIEGNIADIRNNRFFRGSPQSVLGMLQALPLKYGVHVLFLENREEAQAYIKGILDKYYRYFLRVKVDELLEVTT